MRTRPRTEGGLHGILHERVKCAANQLVQIIKASAVSYYGERAQRNPAVIEVSPHHMGEFPLDPLMAAHDGWRLVLGSGFHPAADAY